MNQLRKQLILLHFYTACFFCITGLFLSCAPLNPNNAPRIYSSTSPGDPNQTDNTDRDGDENSDRNTDNNDDNDDNDDNDNRPVRRGEEFVSEMPEDGPAPITRNL